MLGSKHVCMCPAPASYISISSSKSRKYSKPIFSKDILDVSVGLQCDMHIHQTFTSFRRTGGLDSNLAASGPAAGFVAKQQHHHKPFSSPKVYEFLTSSIQWILQRERGTWRRQATFKRRRRLRKEWTLESGFGLFFTAVVLQVTIILGNQTVGKFCQMLLKCFVNVLGPTEL